MKMVEKLRLGRLTTFLPNKGLPVYNWFYFTEAFSRDLVLLLVETWGLGEGDRVLDPFAGIGTVPLVCKQLGIDCVGYDVHPIMLFASRVKLRDYEVEELKALVRRLTKLKFERRKFEVPDFVLKFFPKPVLEDLIFFKREIMEVGDDGVREFLLLGLMNAAMRCSYAFKDGAAVKVRERRVPPLREELRRRLTRMCLDLESFETKPCKINLERCDARELKLPNESVDAVITSPPYLGKQEYIRAYRIEQEILGLSPPATEQLIGVRAEEVREDFSEVQEFAWGKPTEAKLYFKDMLTSLREFYRVCKFGAKVALVASDACFPSGVIEVCVPLSKLAERIGFKAKRILVVNKRFCTTPARRKVGVTRESILLWEK